MAPLCMLRPAPFPFCGQLIDSFGGLSTGASSVFDVASSVNRGHMVHWGHVTSMFIVDTERHVRLHVSGCLLVNADA